jgi:hypothetical protein
MTAEDRRGAGRARYARLLSRHPLASCERAMEVLEKPLGKLLFSLYQERHPALPMEVDRFAHDDRVFIYDSGGQVLDGGVDRMVGAIACSRERVDLGELLERLREERTKRRPGRSAAHLPGFQPSSTSRTFRASADGGRGFSANATPSPATLARSASP